MLTYLNYSNILDATTLRSINRRQKIGSMPFSISSNEKAIIIKKCNASVKSIKTEISFLIDFHIKNNYTILGDVILKLDAICFFILDFIHDETPSDDFVILGILIKRMKSLINISHKKLKFLDRLSDDIVYNLLCRKRNIIQCINDLENLCDDMF